MCLLLWCAFRHKMEEEEGGKDGSIQLCYYAKEDLIVKLECALRIEIGVEIFFRGAPRFAIIINKGTQVSAT